MSKGILALAALLGVTACEDGIAGPPPGTRSVVLSTRADGVSGTALLTRETSARSTVWVTLNGVTSGQSYSGFISQGTCQSPGAVAATLSGLTATSNLGSVTTRSVPDSVLSAGYHLHYDKAGPPATSVVCGNLD